MTKVFWWRGLPGRPLSNFGDALSPIILERFAGVSTEWSEFADAEAVSVGSILQLAPPGFRGVVAGAGKLREDSSFLPSRQTKILALRGPLTARGLTGSFALGDPGVLSDELLPRIPEKRHQLGIVAHWSDDRLTKRPEFAKYHPLLISPAEHPLDVIYKIGSCRKIVTSSLHGAIVADSFGIPRRVESMWLTKLDTNFKWVDYHLSIGMKFETGVTRTPRYAKVEDLKHSLHDVFRSLRGALQ